MVGHMVLEAQLLETNGQVQFEATTSVRNAVTDSAVVDT